MVANVEELLKDHFLQYASYVIRERAIPNLSDGLKPVQRRILQTLFDMDDGKLHKVANVVGHCMQYHPHGDTSIYNALVNLANRGLLIERQGNYGNLFTGDPPSAMRYIECRLLPLARDILYNPELTHYVPSYDGRRKEPLNFPAKLPLSLLLGCEGIAVGMSTYILPHNPIELMQAMQKALHGKTVELFPDLATGGLLDVSDYRDGNGRVRSRALIEKDEKVHALRIKTLPLGCTTSSLIASIEAAARRQRFNIQQIHDYTAQRVEIEVLLPRNNDLESSLKALYAFSDCEVQVSPNLLLIDKEQPRLESVSSVVLKHGQQLKDILESELKLEEAQLAQRYFQLQLEKLFVEKEIYLELHNRRSLKGIQQAVWLGIKPYLHELERKPLTEDIERLLNIPIRRISAYDNRYVKTKIEELRRQRKKIKQHLEHLNQYSHDWLEQRIQRYRKDFPRRTRLVHFSRTEKRLAAAKEYTLFYQSQQKFLGYRLEEGEKLFCVSEFNRILCIYTDASYCVLRVPEKLYLEKDLLLCLDVEQLKDTVLNVVYRDQATGFPYIKRCKIESFVNNRNYQLLSGGQELLLLSKDQADSVTLHLKRQTGSKNTLQLNFNAYPLSKARSLHGKNIVKRVCQRAVFTKKNKF